MAQDIYARETWYEATARRERPTGFSGEKLEVDVCVIGGGLAGLTTALALVRAGVSVAVVEKHLVGMGASGRNGGFVSNGFALDMEKIALRVGPDAACGLHKLSREGTEFVRAEIATHDPSLKMGDGLLVGVRYDDHGGLKKYGENLNRLYGEEAVYLETADTRNKLNSPRYHGALFFTGGFHIHPLRYVLHLAAEIRKAGGKIFENFPAVSVENRGSKSVVKTKAGEITARHVVHCVSSLGRELHEPSGSAVLPVATYIAVTEPLQQTAINTPCAVADTRRAGDYYRVIDGGRILWGGRITTRVSPPARLAERMKGDMLSTYPQLGNPRMDYAWAGLMGYAIHKMPLIGRDKEGQWFATAFGGHGLNTTAMAGLMIARAIKDGDDDYRRFIPFAPQWAFGQLGRIGVQGSYWWMQARDGWDEKRGK